MKKHVVKFAGASLVAFADENGQIWAAVKPIIDAIGLNADSAVERIKNDEILADVHAIRQVRDSSDRQNAMLCLPIEWVNGWLFSIETNKVKPEIRNVLVRYKRECYKALYDYFNGQTRKIIDNPDNRRRAAKRLNFIWKK